MLATIASLVFF
jgi:hypothetical protein